ncbi:class I SAM-dependent DNA methyltransferase [Vannielia litorea]|uniref:Methyltransferase domain-containing protein n=1 Tax=Vannielia litorea TaxID=1217970 RepID=A0A1N6ILM7_9RHOB|nr:class I SAM-dependent methyltransferase [Vannielia litorea]SIO32948.1 Methyltransferase domain-containing protein [Vannielia litorea]
MSDETLAIYDREVQAYADRTARMPEWPDLLAFAERLPPGGQVLDLGCGPGFYAKGLIEMGFSVDAVDGSAAMVAHARAQGVEARQARFSEITGEAVYDGVWANFSLLHATRRAFTDHLGRILRALTPGGWLHLGMKLGEGEGPDSLGRFYTYYSEAELEARLAEAGFRVTARRHSQGKGLSGDASAFICLLSQAIPEGGTKG